MRDLRAERIPISPDYFKVLQASLLPGRSFSESDEDGKPLVAIIDESTARKYWPTEDPLGRRVRFRRDRTKPWTTIVGIVRDIKSDGLDIDGAPHIYVSTYQDWLPWQIAKISGGGPKIAEIGRGIRAVFGV